MKSICKLACTLLVSVQSFLVTGQEIRNVLLPNISIENTKKKAISVESSIASGTELKFDITYNITNQVAIFGSYNFINWKNHSTPTFASIFFTSLAKKVTNNNYGYTLGIAYLTNLRNNQNFEFLTGYEYQSLNQSEYSYILTTSENIINQNYYKLFLQFNYVKRYSRIHHGSILKFSYLKRTKLFNLEQSLKNNHSPSKNISHFLDVNYFFNYKIVKHFNLFATFQIGTSLSPSFDDGFSIYTKLGLKYKFDF
ncbi:protein of unknown function [Tenacibaculum sp. 190524A02b]|uniref:hypothetical protein n=1 Tax=Tenacibaculum vairaonense TaxID=3137860 RepID=UPI0032B2A009